MTRSLKRPITRKRPEILEYLRVKGLMTMPSFIDVINEVGVEIWPHDGQWPIIDAYEERIPPSEQTLQMAAEHGLELTFEYKYRCFVAACGRRFGKSVVAALFGAQELLVPNAKVLIVSKTTENCEIIFNQIRTIIHTLLGKDEIAADRVRDMELELKNGSSLRVAGKDNVEAKLGSALSLLILDEAKLYNKKLYEQVLRPMLADYSPYSRTILISSPEAGWFETYYNYGQSQAPQWSRFWSINLPTHTNPTISREELEELERTMPPDLYEQEILGKFTSNAGLVVRNFDKEKNTYKLTDYPEMRQWVREYPVIHMIDSGHAHYFASCWVVYNPELDTYFQFGEYYKNKATTSVHAENIQAFEQDWCIDPEIRFADPAASQQIADFVEYDLYFCKAQKFLRETINNLNTLFFQLSETTGKPRFLICEEECPETIRELGSVIWKTGRDDDTVREKEKSDGVKPFLPDKEGPVGGGDKTDWDLFDCLRYGMYSYVKNNGVSISMLDAMDGSDDDMDPFEQMMLSQGWIKR